ncbi:transcription factor IBH1-like [Rhododendron vialii]|uniref:transcription factor IBH1-like n=1 Tax=Rhododendron vialii TaxID=182163 RepID=UPI00265F3BF8|nr:transcription factor IBH1-like [Rhododendron vialii]
MTPQLSPVNPNSIKTRFTHRFLRALKRLRKNNSRTATSSQPSALGRYRKVKLAADASMAAAVGPRRVWSCAMLRKIRSRGFLARRRGRRSCGGAVRRRRVHMGKRGGKSGFGGDRKTEELRRLVPGGEAMDLYSLLDETAHYMKCLSTQVQVMRNIVDFCYTST